MPKKDNAEGTSLESDREVDVGGATATTSTTSSPRTPFNTQESSSTSSIRKIVPKPLPGDMASAIQYHVIMQDISSLVSLNGMANDVGSGGNGGGEQTAHGAANGEEFHCAA